MNHKVEEREKKTHRKQGDAATLSVDWKEVQRQVLITRESPDEAFQHTGFVRKYPNKGMRAARELTLKPFK